MNRLSWRKGRITKVIESCDNNVRAVELNVYQRSNNWLCTTRRFIQHLIFLEIQNEPVKQERLRRVAVSNTKILRKIIHELN